MTAFITVIGLVLVAAVIVLVLLLLRSTADGDPKHRK